MEILASGGSICWQATKTIRMMGRRCARKQGGMVDLEHMQPGGIEQTTSYQYAIINVWEAVGGNRCMPQEQHMFIARKAGIGSYAVPRVAWWKGYAAMWRLSRGVGTGAAFGPAARHRHSA